MVTFVSLICSQCHTLHGLTVLSHHICVLMFPSIDCCYNMFQMPHEAAHFPHVFAFEPNFLLLTPKGRGRRGNENKRTWSLRTKVLLMHSIQLNPISLL